MAGGLVFPVKFDLQKAVTDASGDIDKVLRRLETQINSHPLKINIQGGFSNMGIIGSLQDAASKAVHAQQMIAKDGSIEVMRKEMHALVLEWEKLSESERTATDASGKFTGRAGDIVKRFAELTSAANTHARTLSQLVSAANQAVAAEEKRMKAQAKAVEKAQQKVAMLKAEETSLKAVSDKMKFYQQIANSHDFGSQQYKYATWELKRLGAQYSRLISIMQTRTANTGKDIFNAEKNKRLLASTSKDIDTLTKKLQYYQNLLNRLDFNTKPGAFTKVAKEVERLTKDLEEAKRKAAELSGQSTSGASSRAKNARNVNAEYSKQLSYLDRLIRRMMVYTSVGMIGNFLTKIREVTAQFELQRISLGAILQDQNKANQLFSEIKSFALKSPVKILDLTKYTKQLAAYKIGYDELFETTKRLTDVSVGLGVSMDRIVLLYGQVRATGYLRASEVRQATEAGIPLVEELAAKLTKANGELVTAADVMDMISKRAISFDMVKEVFEDMTSAGGIFYNMQEKQGNTLYGMWEKLGDAVSIMYEQIGNTSIINSGMKALIDALTWLMKNWRLVIGEVAVAAAGYGAFRISQDLVTVSTIAASKATRDYARAQIQLNAAQKSGSDWGTKAAKASLKAAAANRAAAMSTNLWTAAKFRLIGALNALKAALMSNWITLAISAIVAVGVAIGAAIEKATRLKRQITEIKNETSTLQAQSVRNFEYLVKEATTAADGSKKQKDALDELHRTYKDILPEETLRIENLRKLGKGYNELTQAIRENIAAQQAEKMRSAIKESVGADIASEQKALRGILETSFGLSDTEIDKFFPEFEKRVAKTGEVTLSTIREINEALHLGLSEWDMEKISRNGTWLDPNHFQKLAESYKELEDRLKSSREWERQAALDLGVYNQEMERYHKAVEANLKAGDTMLQNQQNVDMQINYMGGAILRALDDVGIAWKTEWADIVDEIDPNNLNKTTTLNMEAILAAIDPNQYPELYNYISEYKKLYDGLIPPSPTVQQIRAKLFAISDATGVSMDKMRRFLWDGKASVDDHLKFLNENIEQYKAKLKETQEAFSNSGMLGTIASLFLGSSIKETEKIIEALTAQAEFVMTYTIQKDKSSGRSRSDNRLQELQEINQTLEKINKEYNDLQKKEGKTKALEDLKKQFKDTLAYTNKLGKKFGLHFDFPTEFKSLQQYRNAILKVMKSLEKLKGGEKAILEFQTMISKADSDELQKQIEEQLKAIADRISRTKTAKEFYEKILSMTGDYDLAAKASVSIYGDTGHELQEQLVQQIQQYFQNDRINIQIPIDVITSDNQINYKLLAEFAERMKDVLGKEPYEAIKKIAEQGQKDLAKTYEGYLKDLAKAKTYADKRIELARTTAEKIREIENNPQLSKEQKASLKRGYQEREEKEAAKLEYEAFKDTPLYVQMFEDLERASTSTLEMMKSRLEALSRIWGTALDPTQLKEIQSRMNEIDSQLRTRNPFKTLKESYQQYRDAVKSVSVNGAAENVERASKDYFDTSTSYGADSAQARAAEKELKARKKILEIARKVNEENKKGQNALDFAAQKANSNLKIKRGELEIAAAEEQALRDKSTYEDPNEDPKVIAAHEAVEAAKEEVNLAERVAEITTNNAKTSKTMKENFASVASQVVQYMGMTGELAHAVADTMEALGGDEDDVQFWNDIGTAISDLTAGLQGIVDSILSLNISGIISNAIGIIPNMVKGFMGLFSAGKIRNANKEIKKQQKILDQLEYTYSRLEKAADKVFGADYLNNFNQRYKNLQAQAEAYQKQYEAEKSKGKKADKEKLEEYENAYRDTMDEIADMQGQVAERMLGTDITSAARDFAQAWLDAYAEFSSTADAMSEKFHDMVENMIVESLLAKVMERALQPAFDMIDSMEENDFYSESFWKKLMAIAEQGAQDADHGANVIMDWVEKMGISMREASSEFSGIAKEVAGATSEEINNVAAIGNTLMYYVSPIPRIDENLARIVAIMQGGEISTLSGTGTPSADYTGLLSTANEHLSSLPRMEQHLAEIHTMLGRVITFDSGRFGVNTFIRK